MTRRNIHRQVLTCRRARYVVAVSTLMLTVAGISSYISVIYSNGSANVFEVVSVPLFALLFGWIAFSFSIATLGFVCRLQTKCSVQESSETNSSAVSRDVDDATCEPRTAILMPIYNESPESVFAGIRAMVRSLEDSKSNKQFDFYILSDTTKHDIWLREECAWDELLRETEGRVNVFYRHRPKNSARKAGNIADFVTRWGSDYAYMIVLDADSLVAADTMMEMVSRMDSDPQLGILQAPPLPVGRKSLFARLQQFSAYAYGPVFVQGFAQWSGSEGNYWGHNAIIRVDAFRSHCALPVLSGKAPLGGEILSHDFVEAALMLRAGWKVELAVDLDGSYEECPTTIADYAQRDQRWCQGNLQHAKLLVADNFRMFSRIHFGSGIMSYVASPIWVAFTALCLSGMLLDRSQADDTVTQTRIQLPIALYLFAVSMGLLLLPKFWATILQSIRLFTKSEKYSIRCLDLFRLWMSVLMEVVASVLLSPIMAVYHTRFVLAAFAGKSIQWSAQQRGEHGVTWSDAIRQCGRLTVGASFVTVILWYFTPDLILWFSPLLIGALMSIPISVAMGSRGVGLRAKRLGVFMTPEESSPSSLCIHHGNALRESQMSDDNSDSNQQGEKDLFHSVIHEPKSYVLHNRIQRASESDVPLPTSQSKAIEAAFVDGGADRIPIESRTALLNDLQTLKSLHLQAQLGS